MISDLFTDWKFWSFLVAAIALVLSQLPPLHILLRRAKLDLELYSRISITHKVGNPNLTAHLIIRNIGGRKLRIKSIVAEIHRDNNLICALPAQTFMSDPLDKQTMILTSFNLSPDEESSFVANFLNYFSRDEEKIYKAAEKKLKDKISEIRKSLKEDEIAKVDESYCLPFEDLFKKKFIWKAGEYRLSIWVKTETPTADLCKSFRFTLFESQSDELSSYMNDINTGAGIYWLSSEHSGIGIEIEEDVNN